ncbi:hypothetical protein [Vibrio nomapromontoriensis]|uniref:hypothetical protein n=1 Tax=Vibrio nomapromontoriensis TaxID=2910246 RepID=UPI003D128C31
MSALEKLHVREHESAVNSLNHKLNALDTSLGMGRTEKVLTSSINLELFERSQAISAWSWSRGFGNKE